jgi:hypothetical protein
MKKFVAVFAAVLLTVAVVGPTFAQQAQTPKGTEGPDIRKVEPKGTEGPDVRKKKKTAAAAAPKPKVEPKGTEGPGIRKVEPKGTEGPDVRKSEKKAQ